MTEAYIYDHVRTPRGRGKKDGTLHQVTAVELLSQTLKALRDRNELDTSLVDDAAIGGVTPIGEEGANIARTAVLNADYAETVAGYQLNRYCASGLVAVNSAAAEIKSGVADMAIGGGVEVMSRVPMGSDGGAWPMDPAVASKLYFTPQGVSADLIATKWGYSRDDVDSFAVESQRRAKNAWDNGYFAKSVIPVTDVNGVVLLDHDEHMRPEATMQSLAGLNPSFAMIGENFGFNSLAIQKYPEIEEITHVHHAGNSSGIVDGAAAVLLGNAEAGKRAGLTPRARIVGWADIGSEPTIMLTGPAPSARKALKRAGMSTGDIDLWEINEAFAAVVLRFRDELEIDPDRINVNGGAIAMGHPLGATGAMILGTVLDELERRDLSTALITLCIGAGMGTATIIERV
jgi:acetyl-CoA C-acetyltransferase